jgi:hypothetical protein
VTAWLTAFAFTQIVEVPIWRRALDGRTLVAFGASTLTHPIVWFVFPHLGLSPGMMLLSCETFAVVVEALYMRVFGLRRALLWSLAANGASCGLGLLSRYLWGVP